MSVSIYYQTKEQSLTSIKHAEDIPSDATIIWYDLNEPTEEESDYLLRHFEFNPLEMDDTIHANRELNIKPMKIIKISCFIQFLRENMRLRY